MIGPTLPIQSVIPMVVCMPGRGRRLGRGRLRYLRGSPTDASHHAASSGRNGFTFHALFKPEILESLNRVGYSLVEHNKSRPIGSRVSTNNLCNVCVCVCGKKKA